MQGSNRNQSEGRSEPDSARQCRGPTASSRTRVRGKITLKFEHYRMAGSGRERDLLGDIEMSGYSTCGADVEQVERSRLRPRPCLSVEDGGVAAAED